MTLRALPSHYAGCLFRSRLEARWAVFFDHLGITWEHEPEGYETSAGRYLPDFTITVPSDPCYPYFFEVKPDIAAVDARHAALAADSERPVVVAHGMPRSYRGQMGKEASPLRVHLDDTPARPCAFIGRQQGWTWDGRFEHGAFVEPYDMIHKGRDWSLDTNTEPHLALYVAGPANFVPFESPDVDHAYAAARSARFEPGQRG